MKKHGMKILIGVYVLLIGATIALCLWAMGGVEELSNNLTTQANVLKTQLTDTSPVAKIPTDFHSGRVLNRIHSNWSHAAEVPERTFPTSVLRPPPDSGEE